LTRAHLNTYFTYCKLTTTSQTTNEAFVVSNKDVFKVFALMFFAFRTVVSRHLLNAQVGFKSRLKCGARGPPKWNQHTPWMLLPCVWREKASENQRLIFSRRRRKYLERKSARMQCAFTHLNQCDTILQTPCVCGLIVNESVRVDYLLWLAEDADSSGLFSGRLSLVWGNFSSFQVNPRDGFEDTTFFMLINSKPRFSFSLVFGGT
jgi:hypothetical protein